MVQGGKDISIKGHMNGIDYAGQQPRAQHHHRRLTKGPSSSPPSSAVFGEGDLAIELPIPSTDTGSISLQSLDLSC